MSETITGIAQSVHKVLSDLAMDWERYAVIQYTMDSGKLQKEVDDKIKRIRQQWDKDGTGTHRKPKAIMTADPLLALKARLDILGQPSSSDPGYSRRDLLGFLSPDGVFYENTPYNGHQTTCEELCKALKICPTEFIDPQWMLVDILGWVKFEWYQCYHRQVSTKDEVVDHLFTGSLDNYQLSWCKKLTKAQELFLLGLIKSIRHLGGEVSDKFERRVLTGK